MNSQIKTGPARQIIICECGSREHQIVMEYDAEDNCIFCSIHLVKRNLLARVKTALKYILGYKSKYGHWDCFILCPSEATKLSEYLTLLK